MSLIREPQIGALKVLEYLAATSVVVGAVVWGWYLTLFVAFILAVLPHAVLCAIRYLEKGTGVSRRPRPTLAKEER